VPKRVALTDPERIAALIARPMQLVAAAARPLVYLLSASTDAVLRLFGVRRTPRTAVSLEEIKVLIEEGTEEGVLEPSEHEMVSNVLNLDERHVAGILTPRSDVVFLDVRDRAERVRETLRNEPHHVLPLCDGSLDHVVGFVRATRVLGQVLEERPLDLAALAEPPSFVPETMTLMALLEQFKRTNLPVALVVDEHGQIEGLVTLADVTSSIVGDAPLEGSQESPIVRRDDGSWLMDGGLDLDVVMRTLDDDSLLEKTDRHHYHTLGGLAMAVLGRVPRTGDLFQRGHYRFEVMDMDGNRVDRILAIRRDRTESGGAAKRR
jgi:putative hemolysin